LVAHAKIKSVCAKALGIERKNTYRKSKLAIKDKQLAEQIKHVHKSDPAYGHRRVAWELGINPKRALRVMNKFGIKPPRRKAKKYWCTRSTDKHSYTNLIKEITPQAPHQIWASDVSYIKFQGRFWYLSTIEDVTTRQIMAAQVGKHHDAELVKTTILQALKTGVKPKYFHTDQGTEFMARENTDLLEKHGVQVSVSRLASPWENGYKESFFGRFKDEFGDCNRFEHIGELIEEIYSKVHYYNHRRRHTAFKVAPVVYAKQLSDNGHQKRGA
jgi:putative transposase